MGPLTALARAYEVRRQETLDMPHLGLPGCARHSIDPAILPEPDIAEMSSKTKEPVALSVEVLHDGKTELVPLKIPCSYGVGTRLTSDLVRLGVHPLDIIISTWDARTDTWVFRTSVDHLFWTSRDQDALERERAWC